MRVPGNDDVGISFIVCVKYTGRLEKAGHAWRGLSSDPASACSARMVYVPRRNPRAASAIRVYGRKNKGIVIAKPIQPISFMDSTMAVEASKSIRSKIENPSRACQALILRLKDLTGGYSATPGRSRELRARLKTAARNGIKNGTSPATSLCGQKMWNSGEQQAKSNGEISRKMIQRRVSME